VIVATALGPHVRRFHFSTASWSSGMGRLAHGLLALRCTMRRRPYIAMTLDVRGPTLTLTHSISRSIRRSSWPGVAGGEPVRCRAGRRHRGVGRGAGDRVRPDADAGADGRIKPFAFSTTPESVPGEGSAFFVLTRAAADARYGRVADVARNMAPPAADAPCRCSMPAGCRRTKPRGGRRSCRAFRWRVTRRCSKPDDRQRVAYGGGGADVAATSALSQPGARQSARRNAWRESMGFPWRDVFCSQLDCSGGQMVIHLAG